MTNDNNTQLNDSGQETAAPTEQGGVVADIDVNFGDIRDLNTRAHRYPAYESDYEIPTYNGDFERTCMVDDLSGSARQQAAQAGELLSGMFSASCADARAADRSEGTAHVQYDVHTIGADGRNAGIRHAEWQEISCRGNFCAAVDEESQTAGIRFSIRN